MMRSSTAAALLLIAATLAGCSAESSGVLDAATTLGDGEQVRYGTSCEAAEDVWTSGDTDPLANSDSYSPFSNLDELKAAADVQDGVFAYNDFTDNPLNLETLTERQNSQLWESYKKWVETVEQEPDGDNLTKKHTTIHIYGDPNPAIFDEYRNQRAIYTQGGELPAPPSSQGDGVIDSPDLNLCVARLGATVYRWAG